MESDLNNKENVSAESSAEINNNTKTNEKLNNNIAETVDNKKTLSKKENFYQVAKFVGFSISAGVIQTLTFTLLNELIKWPYLPSYLIALTLSVLWNFTLNREFTFKSANNVPIAMLLVGAYYLVFTPLSGWWGDALTNVGWNEYLVFFLTMLINLVTEFLYCRFVVYRNSINTNKRAKNKQKN